MSRFRESGGEKNPMVKRLEVGIVQMVALSAGRNAASHRRVVPELGGFRYSFGVQPAHDMCHDSSYSTVKFIQNQDSNLRCLLNNLGA